MAPTRRWRRCSVHFAIFGLLAALPLLLMACTRLLETRPPETRSPVCIRICGSSSMAVLLDELTGVYIEAHPHVTFQTLILDSREGLRAVLQGAADIGLVARPLQDTELLDSDTGERRLSTTVIALDGIAIVVNAANPLERLSLAEIHSIYTGEAWDWSGLGGPSGEIAVVTREEGSGTREVFQEAILQGDRLTPRALIMPSAEAVAHYVEEHPEAIGYLSAAGRTEGIKTLNIAGVSPEKKTILSGQYPLVRPFYLVTAAKPQSEVQAFIHFVTGRTGQAIVRRDRPVPR
ncbi:MAG: phosphate ABC transporter substrate-binding protein [Chloroflexota bacterium]|nr:phosphate ABC transporter substrate-binding protein [Anaerolineae bacterium]